MPGQRRCQQLLETVLLLTAFTTVGCSRGPDPVPAPVTGITDDDALAAAREASDSAAGVDGEGFRPLRLTDFTPFPADSRAFSQEAGVLKTTGKPKGYLFSKKSYGNFTWRAEFRFLPDADGAKNPESNTGFMLCIHEPHKVWPRSLEVQGKHVEMGQIKSNGGVPNLTINDDVAAREAARHPVGEWNTLEIVCRDGAVSSSLNGKAICFSEPGELKDGLIGLQSENFPVEFRGLKIRED